jgi:RNA polymerase sigma-70 factor (ECF subfamily)
MEDPIHGERWESLLGFLAPLHHQALATARRLCRSAAEGDDLYQEAVLRAFHKLPALRDEGRFRSWFFAVLLSVHRGRSRRAFWRRFLPLSAAEAGGNDPVGEDGRRGADEHEQAARASRALAKLPGVQREAVVLHDIEAMTMVEIAAMQGVTVSAVKTRVARGRERLRAHYRRLGLGPRQDLPGEGPSGEELSRQDLPGLERVPDSERNSSLGWTASPTSVRRESS